MASDVYDGKFTAKVVEQFSGLVKSAFREVIRESVHHRLTSALAETEQAPAEPPSDDSEDDVDDIVTTDDEREGFFIIRGIVRETIRADRVFIRDQKSYCSVLVDNNNRRRLARMYFNRSVKYIGLFDGEKEERVLIDSLDHIYDHTDRLRATAAKFKE